MTHPVQKLYIIILHADPMLSESRAGSCLTNGGDTSKVAGCTIENVQGALVAPSGQKTFWWR